MHMVRFNTPTQLVSGLLAKARHAEPSRYARRRDDREAAERRIKAATRAIAECQWGPGPLHSVEV